MSDSEFYAAIRYALSQLACKKMMRARALWERLRDYSHPQMELDV
jgi:hypothetical protein